MSALMGLLAKHCMELGLTVAIQFISIFILLLGIAALVVLEVVELAERFTSLLPSRHGTA